jgi:hypothetical protein
MSKIDYTLWPNAEGTLGQNKVEIPDGVNTKWPDGDALVGNFVYDGGELVGFVDTKALINNSSKSTTFPYDYVNIQVDKSLEGVISFNKGERTKHLTITYVGSANSNETFDFVIIDFNTTDQETINTVRTAKRVVDNKLYDADDNLIGTIDTSKIEVAGIFDTEAMKLDGLFCNIDVMTMGARGLILSEFDSDLSSLTNGENMFFYCSNLTSFNADMPKLTNGGDMFDFCENLESFSSDLPSLTNGTTMFQSCYKLTSFSSDLSSLTDGHYMFGGCFELRTFSSGLPKLTNGDHMFHNCRLNTASVQHIADTINTPSDKGIIHIDIGPVAPNEQQKTAFNTIASKNWSVYVNGSQYTPTSPAAIITLDETGKEIATPIPFWAKPVQSDEQHAHYVDEQGNFYNILGAQFIYGDSLENYGMFTCEADAAANMRLTKIEK